MSRQGTRYHVGGVERFGDNDYRDDERDYEHDELHNEVPDEIIEYRAGKVLRFIREGD